MSSGVADVRTTAHQIILAQVYQGCVEAQDDALRLLSVALQDLKWRRIDVVCGCTVQNSGHPASDGDLRYPNHRLVGMVVEVGIDRPNSRTARAYVCVIEDSNRLSSHAYKRISAKVYLDDLLSLDVLDVTE